MFFMNKGKLKGLLIILILIVIVLSISLLFLYYENKTPKKVFFEEKTINLLQEEPEKVCSELCEEKDYDGVGGIKKESERYTCNCYKLAK